MNVAAKSKAILTGLKKVKRYLRKTTDTFSDDIRLDNLLRAYISLKFANRHMHGGDLGDQFKRIVKDLQTQDEWTMEEDFLRDQLYAHRERLYEQMEFLGLVYYDGTQDKGDSEIPPRKK